MRPSPSLRPKCHSELRPRSGAGELIRWAVRMASRLCGGRWLPFHTRQSSINTSPTRRAGGPDRHCGARKIRIVESTSPHEDQMRSCLSLAEERGAAIAAEPAVHSIATVGHTQEVARFPHDLERCGAKAGANRPAACSQILAIAAPAHPSGDWRFRALPANRTAEAPACHCHCALQGQERVSISPRIVRLPPCSNPAGPPNPSPHPNRFVRAAWRLESREP